MRAAVALAALLAVPGPALAQTYLVVVAGLGGEPRFRDTFHETAVTLIDAAVGRHGVDARHVTYLGERPARAPDRIQERSTKEAIVAVCADLATRAGPDALIAFVFIGHGSQTGGTARINLPGPDLTAQEFAELLDGFPSQEVLVVNTTSASGGWIESLSGPRRTILTATRSGVERHETYFATHFAAALAGDGADVDKDQRISILEAFEYARREVERVYAADNRLQTEHALLDDDGDGQGTLEPGTAGGDGARAARLFLAGTTTGAAPSDNPAIAALQQRRDSLTRAVETLRAQREAMPAPAYDRELQRLLLEIARVGRALRERGGNQ